jgi:hypothetical protein
MQRQKPLVSASKQQYVREHVSSAEVISRRSDLDADTTQVVKNQICGRVASFHRLRYAEMGAQIDMHRRLLEDGAKRCAVLTGMRKRGQMRQRKEKTVSRCKTSRDKGKGGAARGKDGDANSKEARAGWNGLGDARNREAGFAMRKAFSAMAAAA